MSYPLWSSACLTSSHVPSIGSLTANIKHPNDDTIVPLRV